MHDNFVSKMTFRDFCSCAMPADYDDSLTLPELLAKLVNRLNSFVDSVNATNQNVIDMYTAFNDLQAYVDTYFENLDVESVINARFQELVNSGYFLDVINTGVFPEFRANLESMCINVRYPGRGLTGYSDSATVEENRAAIAAIFQYVSENTQSVQGGSGSVYRCTFPTVFFPTGKYDVGEQHIPQYVHISGDQPMFIGSTKFINDVVGEIAYDNLVFVNCVNIPINAKPSRDIDSCRIMIRNCRFAGCTAGSIYTSQWSAITLVEGCSFTGAEKYIYSRADRLAVRDCWFSESPSGLPTDYMIDGKSLLVDECHFIPKKNQAIAYIHCTVSCSVINSRVGGESGAKSLLIFDPPSDYNPSTSKDSGAITICNNPLIFSYTGPVVRIKQVPVAFVWKNNRGLGSDTVLIDWFDVAEPDRHYHWETGVVQWDIDQCGASAFGDSTIYANGKLLPLYFRQLCRVKTFSSGSAQFPLTYTVENGICTIRANITPMADGVPLIHIYSRINVHSGSKNYHQVGAEICVQVWQDTAQNSNFKLSAWTFVNGEKIAIPAVFTKTGSNTMVFDPKTRDFNVQVGNTETHYISKLYGNSYTRATVAGSGENSI